LLPAVPAKRDEACGPVSCDQFVESLPCRRLIAVINDDDLVGRRQHRRQIDQQILNPGAGQVGWKDDRNVRLGDQMDMSSVISGFSNCNRYNLA